MFVCFECSKALLRSLTRLTELVRFSESTMQTHEMVHKIDNWYFCNQTTYVLCFMISLPGDYRPNKPSLILLWISCVSPKRCRPGCVLCLSAFCVSLLFLRLMTSGVLTKDGSRAIRVYESSKKCPEAISHLDFQCEKPSIQHLASHCNVLYLRMLRSEDPETFKSQANWTMGQWKNITIRKFSNPTLHLCNTLNYTLCDEK